MTETEQLRLEGVGSGEDMPQNKPEWPYIGMTVREAGEALRVSPRTIQHMLRAGKLPGRIIGNKWRVDVDALKRALDSVEDAHRVEDEVD